MHHKNTNNTTSHLLPTFLTQSNTITYLIQPNNDKTQQLDLSMIILVK